MEVGKKDQPCFCGADTAHAMRMKNGRVRVWCTTCHVLAFLNSLRSAVAFEIAAERIRVDEGGSAALRAADPNVGKYA